MTNTKRRLVFISVLIAMFISAVEATIVTTAMPSIAASLGSFSRYSWIFSSYLLMSTVTVLIYGKLADLYGRKPIFLIGVTIFTLGSFGAGFSMTMEWLIFFRFIQGIGAGAVAPIATTIVGDLYSLEERAKVQGYMSSVWGISAIVGPAIGGLIVQYWTWQYIFWINIPLGILAMIGVFLFLEEEQPKRTVSIDYKGAIASAIFIGTFIVWLTEGSQQFGYFDIVGITLLFVSIVSFILFLVIEKRAQSPVVPLEVWRHPTIFYTNIVTFLTGMILIAVSSYLPTYVTGVMTEKAIVAGFTLTAMSIGWPLASTIAGHLLIRFGVRPIALVGGLHLVIGVSLLLFLTSATSPLYVAFSSFIIGVGMGLTSTSFIISIQSAVPYEMRGAATASNMFMRNLGNTLGASLFGAILMRALMKQLQSTPYDMNDANVILSTASRQSVNEEKLLLLQQAMHMSLQYVFSGMLLVACIAFFILFKLPKGKVIVHDSNRT